MKKYVGTKIIEATWVIITITVGGKYRKMRTRRKKGIW
jgi:hypothetical protein